ncbi:MAG TPA: ribosome maturation factor RimP [Acidimicrobiales bacterium]|nr:ribosome maturation factor RimP [Acidimicrobiales bacterium]
MATVQDEVRRLVEPLVTPHGVEVVDVEHGPGLLRISLDNTDRDTPIDLDTITTFSEQISDLLDLHDPVPGRYTLEVSSPGLERPLKTKEQFQRFVGTTVSIKTKSHVDGDRRFTGTLSEATDDHVTVADRTLAYHDIEKAKTVFEWGPTPKRTPSKPQQNKKTKKATTS